MGMAESQFEFSHTPKELIHRISSILEEMDQNLEIIADEAKGNMEGFINTKEDLHRM